MQPPIYSQCEDRVGYYQGNLAGIYRTSPKGHRLRPLFKCDFDTMRKAKNARDRFVATGDYTLFKRAVKISRGE